MRSRPPPKRPEPETPRATVRRHPDVGGSSDRTCTTGGLRASGARAAVRDSGGSAPHSSARCDDGEAFLHDPHGGPARAREVLAATLARDFLDSATSAQDVTEDARDIVLAEEAGELSVDEPTSGESADEDELVGDVDETRAPRTPR